MQELASLEFTSRDAENYIRILCAGLKVPFETVEEHMLRSYVLIAPGTAQPTDTEIGRHRFMECPSRRLDKACRDFILAKDEPRRKVRIAERRRQEAAGIPDPLAAFEAEWRKIMGFEVFDQIDSWLADWRREYLPVSARRELAKLDRKTKMKRQLRIVK